MEKRGFESGGAMVSESATRCANELRELLEAGVLTRLGRVLLHHPDTLDFDVAVKIMLADLAHLAFLEQRGDYVSSGRWRHIGEQLEYLHGLAVAPAAR
jgi:hypothetical protein